MEPLDVRVLEKLDTMIPRLLSLRQEIDDLITDLQLAQSKKLTLANRKMLKLISELVLEYFDTNLEEIRSKSKKREYTAPRQILATLLKHHTNFSLYDIGAHVHRDHSTITHCAKVLRNAKDVGDRLFWQYDEIEKQLLAILKYSKPISEEEKTKLILSKSDQQEPGNHFSKKNSA